MGMCLGAEQRLPCSDTGAGIIRNGHAGRTGAGPTLGIPGMQGLQRGDESVQRKMCSLTGWTIYSVDILSTQARRADLHGKP